MDENCGQSRQRRAVQDANEYVTLTKEEFELLKASENKARQWDKFRVAIIWTLVTVFVITLIITIKITTKENQINGVKFDTYYENEFDRARKESLKSNKRPGRLYHRGGSYGKK